MGMQSLQWRRRNGKCRRNRGGLIEAPEQKGGAGVHMVRMLLFELSGLGFRRRVPLTSPVGWSGWYSNKMGRLLTHVPSAEIMQRKAQLPGEIMHR